MEANITKCTRERVIVKNTVHFCVCVMRNSISAVTMTGSSHYANYKKKAVVLCPKSIDFYEIIPVSYSDILNLMMTPLC